MQLSSCLGQTTMVRLVLCALLAACTTGSTPAIQSAGSDRDGDQIDDSVDRCVTEPEDFDEYQDEDGCPDLDNDSDRFLDADDLCPLVAENFNGYQDDDGCPDDVQPCLPPEGLLIEDRLRFDEASTNFENGEYARVVLDAIAAILIGTPSITSVEIRGRAGSSERPATALALKRAETIRAALQQRGVVTTLVLKGTSIPAEESPTDDAHIQFKILSSSQICDEVGDTNR